MRYTHESLGKARGIVMTVVGVLILVAFLVSRLHLLGFVGKQADLKDGLYERMRGAPTELDLTPPGA